MEKGSSEPFFSSFQHLYVKQERGTMTSLLEKAFEVASKLPALEQNILARALLDEIESEKNGVIFSRNQKTF